MQLSSFVNRDGLADFIHEVTGVDVHLRLDSVGVPVPMQDVIYERHLAAIEAAFVAGVAVASQPHRYLLAGKDRDALAYRAGNNAGYLEGYEDGNNAGYLEGVTSLEEGAQ